MYNNEFNQEIGDYRRENPDTEGNKETRQSFRGNTFRAMNEDENVNSNGLQNFTSRFDTEKQTDHNLITSNNSSFSKIRYLLLEELKGTDIVTKCMDHPSEELQFYSITSDKVLCSQCLSKGGFSGTEIVNIKKATNRVIRKIEDYFLEINNRIDSYSLLEKRLDSTKKDMSEIFLHFKGQIRAGFDDLRKKIQEKERSILEQVETMYREKVWELELAEETIKSRKEEISNLADVLDKAIGKLNDYTVCHYYAKKGHTIRSILGEDDAKKIQETKQLLEIRGSHEQVNLNAFTEGLQMVAMELSALKGLEDNAQINIDILKTNDTSLAEADLGNHIPDNYSIIPKAKDTSRFLQSSLGSSRGREASPKKPLASHDKPSPIREEPVKSRVSSEIERHIKEVFERRSSIKKQEVFDELLSNINRRTSDRFSPKRKILSEVFEFNTARQASARTLLSQNSSPTTALSFKTQRDSTHARGTSMFSLGPSLTQPKSTYRSIMDIKSPSRKSLINLDGPLFSPSPQDKGVLHSRLGSPGQTFSIKREESSLFRKRTGSELTMVTPVTPKGYSANDLNLFGLLQKQREVFNSNLFK